MRLVKVARVFKVARYSSAVRMFAVAIARSIHSLFVLLMVVAICLVVCGATIYTAELGFVGTRGDLCGEKCFKSVLSSCYCIISTITTVGYGDSVPSTLTGQIIAAIASCMGIIMLALPIAVFENNFTRVYLAHEECKKMIKDISALSDDGIIDADEIRTWIRKEITNNRLGANDDDDDDDGEGGDAPELEGHPLTTLDSMKLLAMYDKEGKGFLYEGEALLMMADLDEYHEPHDTAKLSAAVHKMIDMCSGMSNALSSLETVAIGDEYSRMMFEKQKSFQDVEVTAAKAGIFSFRFWATLLHSVVDRQSWAAPTVEGRRDTSLRRVAAGLQDGTLSDADRDKYYENMATATDRVVAFDGSYDAD